jgi:hypothetical protein
MPASGRQSRVWITSRTRTEVVFSSDRAGIVRGLVNQCKLREIEWNHGATPVAIRLSTGYSIGR